jgi:Ca-activated chloride channel family protein
MRIENPWMLLLLLLALPAAWLWLRSVRKRKERIRRFTESAFAGKVFIGDRPLLRCWHFILFFAGLLLLTVAVSLPKIAGGEEKVQINGIDVMIVMDVSNSMNSNDIQPSRIERAKLALESTLKKMNSDRFGIVVFAAHPHVVLPVCDDPTAAWSMIGSISSNNIAAQGTAIGEAITLAVSRFPRGEASKDRGRAIILITDGENFEDDAVEAARDAADNGVIVSVIGIGTEEGGKIPVVDREGKTGFKHDRKGKEVITKINEELLKEIARNGKGVYVRSTSADIGVGTVYAKLQGLSKGASEVFRQTNFIQLFPWLAGFALLLLLIEPLLPEGKRNENKPRP